MARRIAIHPAARTDLLDLYAWIDGQSGPGRAGAFIDRLERACASLADLPERGVPRDDLAPGVRTLAVERRTVIAFRVGADTVTILRVVHAGRAFGADDVPP